ncbi:MAG: SPFH domain-containing protein [[Clostridium] innocuum]
MGFSDLLMGQFIDVIENDKDMSHLIVLKYQRNSRDNEIKQGAKLIVRESQAAVFMNKGELADVFSAGSHNIEYGEPADSFHTAKLEIRLSLPDYQ